jgi:hypothetical protein
VDLYAQGRDALLTKPCIERDAEKSVTAEFPVAPASIAFNACQRPRRKALTMAMVAVGFSSMIQCPLSGITPSCTLLAA